LTSINFFSQAGDDDARRDCRRGGLPRRKPRRTRTIRAVLP